jgi:hypothetical protein
MKHKELYGKTIRQTFEDFHKKNPQVFQIFCDLAIQEIEQYNAKKVSHQFIGERIRRMRIGDTGDFFKINQNYLQLYGKMFVRKYPQYTSKFNFRKARNEEGGPYMEQDGDQLRFF